MLSDILFLCLVLICLYLIFITLKKKNILNFDNFFNFKDRVKKIYINKNKNSLSNKILKSKEKESNKIKSNQIIKSSASYKKTIQNSVNNSINYQIDTKQFITEDTENLIEEVINQENNQENNILLVN